MRRWLVVPLVLFTIIAVAKEKPLAKELLEAKTVKVMVLPGNLEHVGAHPLYGYDRNAVNDVKKALERWGRWKVVKETEPADLVILVRLGHVAVLGSEVLLGDVHSHTGAAIAANEHGDARNTNMVEIQRPPKEDIFAVFTPREAKSAVYVAGGKIINGKPLWVLNEGDVVQTKGVPAVQRLRDAIEQNSTAAKN